MDARVVARHLLGEPPHVELTRVLFEGVRGGEFRARSSAILVYQLLTEPSRAGRGDLGEEAYRYLSALSGFDLEPVTPEISRQAAEVRARLGLRTEPALHMATALAGGAALLLTEGSGLRRVADLEVVNLDDFL